MTYSTLRKLCCIALLLLCTACPVPDVDEYSELTRTMTETLKASATEVVDFLDEGLSFPEDDATGMDPLLLEDLAGLQGKEYVPKPADYPKQLRRNWHTIFKTLDALVAYSDALAAIKDSGAKGKVAFGNLADALNNVLAVSGIAIPGAVSTAGGYLYDKIAQIRAKNKLQDVITNADAVIQHVALTLDSALYYMENVNDVAKSENLLRRSDSEEARQINELYASLVEKEKRNRVKIILLNDYENGDYESLRFFVYEDPLSLDKLGIKDLTDAIGSINATGGLSPRERLERIATLAGTTFKTAVDDRLTNAKIVTTLDIEERRIHMQQELDFIRRELEAVAPKYHKNREDQKQIEEAAARNAELIGYSRKLIGCWSGYHARMKYILAKKQKLSLNELKLYINEIKALKKEIDEQR